MSFSSNSLIQNRPQPFLSSTLATSDMFQRSYNFTADTSFCPKPVSTVNTKQNNENIISQDDYDNDDATTIMDPSDLSNCSSPDSLATVNISSNSSSSSLDLDYDQIQFQKTGIYYYQNNQAQIKQNNNQAQAQIQSQNHYTNYIENSKLSNNAFSTLTSITNAFNNNANNNPIKIDQFNQLSHNNNNNNNNSNNNDKNKNNLSLQPLELSSSNSSLNTIILDQNQSITPSIATNFSTETLTESTITSDSNNTIATNTTNTTATTNNDDNSTSLSLTTPTSPIIPIKKLKSSLKLSTLKKDDLKRSNSMPSLSKKSVKFNHKLEDVRFFNKFDKPLSVRDGDSTCSSEDDYPYNLGSHRNSADFDVDIFGYSNALNIFNRNLINDDTDSYIKFRKSNSISSQNSLRKSNSHIHNSFSSLSSPSQQKHHRRAKFDISFYDDYESDDELSAFNYSFPLNNSNAHNIYLNSKQNQKVKSKSKSKSKVGSWKIKSTNFDRLLSTPRLVDTSSDLSSNICLETIFLSSSPDSITPVKYSSPSSSNNALIYLIGLILVKNIAYDKRVTIKLTLNNWSTFKEVEATYLKSVNNQIDKFKFALNLNDLDSMKLGKLNLQMCLNYQVNNSNYWDNNNNSNYELSLSNSKHKARKSSKKEVSEKNLELLNNLLANNNDNNNNNNNNSKKPARCFPEDDVYTFGGCKTPTSSPLNLTSRYTFDFTSQTGLYMENDDSDDINDLTSLSLSQTTAKSSNDPLKLSKSQSFTNDTFSSFNCDSSGFGSSLKDISNDNKSPITSLSKLNDEAPIKKALPIQMNSKLYNDILNSYCFYKGDSK
ncbi:protein phosphatase regulator GAC1 [Ascoidea rubescens DSM 1968]|uniref:Carbohydrate-binding module family 21 protein n=1 Tax=Ascoidea rubescens DSM 1968 TaxID=1344418 RepID=A0A1D2VAL9_9ASCO|nr:carbohydrate-binding module family 21 protein [Ascoidea rubescens DSM 1968]ODV58649.1 carbohydrate-binding module family 21 protein [Ascoidea rubescens DSM 1968]